MKSILITGVSCKGGIGANLVRHFLEEGYKVFAHGSSEYDYEIGYSDAGDLYQDQFIRLSDCDLSVSENIESLLSELADKDFSHMIICHAYSTQCELGKWNTEDINNHLMTNVTATMLLIQYFKKQLKSEKGCITLFTSGQHLGPIISEIPYAVSKAAITNLGMQCSYALADRNIRVNVVNPGPTDTGYIEKDPAIYQKIAD
ncbi:SDR family NAD(P)-dependent oxidoreductase [Macrococcus hajekii]|uniref:SDR family NAD(P)-dependent oxidoreductase n=1 Tax=Macrococcus hajekii TaxID=198482 RepID=A0A4R6BK24_9STAP|nr:SDR family NAD(P)-dependent oxidoreductase [Macrococcus hajekii]TDM01990.1 SDR family NAD(P)-dependent oxidoreductase [Macrococcus hajekii]GGB09097.1 3-ketoacyl-ACP reductase [Macrococcus hajekii]